MKKLSKNNELFQIHDAFQFLAWNSMALSTKDFIKKYQKTFDLVESNPIFKKYLEEDSDYYNRDCDKNQIGFFIEEIFIFYLISKMQVKFQNQFTQNRENWTLVAYPRKPLKSLVYFYQKNIFGLNNTGNVYENSFYDLESKKLYDFDRLNLETWNYE